MCQVEFKPPRDVIEAIGVAHAELAGLDPAAILMLRVPLDPYRDGIAAAVHVCRWLTEQIFAAAHQHLTTEGEHHARS